MSTDLHSELQENDGGNLDHGKSISPNPKTSDEGEDKGAKYCEGELDSEVDNTTKLSADSQMSGGNECQKKDTDDPYAYLDKNGFSSEKYKIEIRGLPKYYGISELRKLLNEKLGLQCNKVKSPGFRSYWVYACFRSEADRENGIKVLDNYKWKGSFFKVKAADPAPDPLVKRRNDDRSGEGPRKRPKLETKESEEEAIKNSVTPLWNMPYDLQLQQKASDAENLLRRLGIELVKENKSLSTWIEGQRKINNGLACKLLQIKGLPEYCDYYRNKCEFSVGKNDLTGKRTVGFRLGSYASGSLSIAPVDCLKNFNQKMLEAVNVFEKFVRDSDLEVFNPETLTGYWRQLTVRVGTVTGQIMLIVGFHPQNLEEGKLNNLKEALKNYFKDGEGAPLNITSLYFQIIRRKQNANDILPYELLLGEKYIEEILCGLKFKISPQSFFQVNTQCASLLIESVKELSGVKKDSTVLDVCCGTGTIGLCLAKDCQQVLGIEIIEEAVKDAKLNASENNITNCEFFCGKADEILSSVVEKTNGDHIIAIVDPPRAGLHNKAINLLRRTKSLERFVFLSCDPKSAFKNFLEFARPQSKKMIGLPFVPVAAIPIDMFPHCLHFEIVIYFERLDIAEKNQKRLLESISQSVDNDKEIPIPTEFTENVS